MKLNGASPQYHLLLGKSECTRTAVRKHVKSHYRMLCVSYRRGGVGVIELNF